MIFVGITEGQLQFSYDAADGTDGKIAFAREDRPKLVLFLRALIEGSWDGHMMFSSSMNWPEEDGWQGDVTPRDFLASCIREAAVPAPAVESPGRMEPMSEAEEIPMLHGMVTSLRRKLDAALRERDEIAREFAELEHKYDQACAALVTLAEMTVPVEPPDDAGVLVPAAPYVPDEKIADDVPTEFAIEERSETMVAEVEAALEAALEEQEREGQQLQTNGNIVVNAEGFAAIEAMIENPPEPTPALVELFRKSEGLYPDGSKIEPASTKPRKKRGQ